MVRRTQYRGMFGCQISCILPACGAAINLRSRNFLLSDFGSPKRFKEEQPREPIQIAA